MVSRVTTVCDVCGAECASGKLRVALWFGINQGTTWDYCGTACMLKSITAWVKNSVEKRANQGAKKGSRK